MEDRVQQIIKLEAEADQAEATASEIRWEAARLIWEELQSGKPQRQLAREIGKSQGHVSKCSAMWERYADSPENRPVWRDAYRGVSGKPDLEPGTTVHGWAVTAEKAIRKIHEAGPNALNDDDHMLLAGILQMTMDILDD